MTAALLILALAFALSQLIWSIKLKHARRQAALFEYRWRFYERQWAQNISPPAPSAGSQKERQFLIDALSAARRDVKRFQDAWKNREA